jgi:hypothetical protein
MTVRLPPPHSSTNPAADLGSQALQDAKAPRSCEGCGRVFKPRRTTQRHCRAGCRVPALRKRRGLGDVSQNNQFPNTTADACEASAVDSNRGTGQPPEQHGRWR